MGSRGPSATRWCSRPPGPAAVFDPTKYFNSDGLGAFGPAESTWALTFDRPGTFEYICAIHRDVGMVGTVVVQPR